MNPSEAGVYCQSLIRIRNVGFILYSFNFIFKLNYFSVYLYISIIMLYLFFSFYHLEIIF